jgi:hypothetical protein
MIGGRTPRSALARKGSLALALAAVALAAGCAAPRTQPLLSLDPASLGGRLALHQQLEFHARDGSQRLEVLLEADAAAVRIAVLGPGMQATARIVWDGRRLEHDAPPGWPPGLPVRCVLSDLQLVLWPAAEIARALPAGWTLDSRDSLRRLRRGDETIATVRYDGARAELANRRAGYRIRIESRPVGGPAP